MGKVNVYLPDDLERAVRDAGIPLSSVCQLALRTAVDRVIALGGAADPAAAMGPVSVHLAEVLAAVPADPTRADGRAGPVELLGAILLHGENRGARVVRELGVELPGRRRVRRSTGLTDEARRVLADAVRVALEQRQDRVGTEHVVLALLREEHTAELFGALGVDERAVRSRLDRTAAADVGPSTAPAALLDRFEAELRRLGDELRQLRGE
jgi:ATP-dependent Clp protease ATP-binding subunit ClpC